MTAVADAGVVTGGRPRGGLLIAGWSAVLGTVLSFARAPLTGELDLPERTASPETIVGFFRGSSFDAAFVGGMVMVCIGWLLYLVFIAKIADLLQIIDIKYRFVGYLMTGGTILNIGMTLGYVATLTVGVSAATGGGVGNDVLVILFGFIWTFIYLGTLVWALVAIPMGYTVVRTAFIPRWMGWAILIIFTANLAANFMPFEVSSVIGGLPYLWTLVAGVMLLIRSPGHLWHGSLLGIARRARSGCLRNPARFLREPPLARLHPVRPVARSVGSGHDLDPALPEVAGLGTCSHCRRVDGVLLPRF